MSIVGTQCITRDTPPPQKECFYNTPSNLMKFPFSLFGGWGRLYKSISPGHNIRGYRNQGTRYYWALLVFHVKYTNCYL